MLHDEVRALADVVSPVDHDRVMAIADEVEALEAALRPVVEALGDHYCGVCGNGGEGDEGFDQPYHTVTDPETQTCSGCRANYDAYRAGFDALKEKTDE